MDQFDIPVALFIFKRDKAVEIVKRLSQVRPKKLYLLADQGRNDEEKQLAAKCRQEVEAAIDWDCELIRDYADENRGVYRNIGQGAIRVLRQEKCAIFLEDDNLPELSFFPFCKEMLERYENDPRVLWVCGTNYLGSYKQKNSESYVFTRHMLPCGWASWSHKFEKNYDGDLVLTEDPEVMKRVKKAYLNNAMYRQGKDCFMSEKRRIDRGLLPVSWDYQMDFSIKAHGLLGICPCNNQIKNIGVDDLSVHGGTSLNMVMTKRFCGMDSYPVEFPLKHPEKVEVDKKFEKKIGKIILYPLKLRMSIKTTMIIRRLFKIPKNKSTKQFFREVFVRNGKNR